MILSKKETTDLFVALGYKTAAGWDEVKLLKKITVLANDDDLDTSKLNKEQSALLDEIQMTVSEGNTLEIAKPQKAAKKAVKKAAKKAVKKAAKKKSSKTPDSDDKEADEDDDDAAPDQPAKKAKKAKSKSPKINRQAIVVATVLKMKKKLFTTAEVAEEANNAYAKAGGNDNVKQTHLLTRRALVVMEALGVVAVTDDKIKVIGKVASA